MTASSHIWKRAFRVLSFCVSITSLRMIISRSIHLPVNFMIEFSFTAECYFIVSLPHLKVMDIKSDFNSYGLWTAAVNMDELDYNARSISSFSRPHHAPRYRECLSLYSVLRVFVFCYDSVSLYIPGWPRTDCVDQVGLSGARTKAFHRNAQVQFVLFG